MRNRLRVLAFDIAAPLAAIAALVFIGIALAWPLWWVSVCSVLCLLIVEGVIVNVVLARRDGVTVGTDDDGPGLRLAVVGLATGGVGRRGGGRLHQLDGARPHLRDDSAEVVGIASSVAEARATFTPQSPTASIDRATATDVAGERRGVQERIRRCGKAIDEQERLGSGQHDLGGCRGHRPRSGQRRGDHAWQRRTCRVSRPTPRCWPCGSHCPRTAGAGWSTT